MLNANIFRNHREVIRDCCWICDGWNEEVFVWNSGIFLLFLNLFTFLLFIYSFLIIIFLLFI